MRYELDTEGAALIFLPDGDIPFMFQPHWPDQTPWADGEAVAWAEQFIMAATDETADLPGDNPAQPTKPRPVIVEDETPELTVE